jgi:hypothetical protein
MTKLALSQAQTADSAISHRNDAHASGKGAGKIFVGLSHATH